MAKKAVKAKKNTMKKNATKKAAKPVAKKVLVKKAKASAKKSVAKAIKKITTKPKASSKKKAVSSGLKKTANSVKILNIGAPFSPLGDKVLIKKAAGLEKTPGGLFIPSTAQDQSTEGQIVAVGPGIKSKKGFLKPLDVKVGDKVMFEKYAGMEMNFQGEIFLILTENEIIGVVS